MTNHDKLKALLIEVFLLDPAEYRPDLTRGEIDTWDSLGVVSMAVGIDETFGYHMAPDEATSVAGVQDIVALLRSKGIPFDELD